MVFVISFDFTCQNISGYYADEERRMEAFSTDDRLELPNGTKRKAIERPLVFNFISIARPFMIHFL
jgi:hypothetical protein